MSIYAIAAIGKNRELGKDNQLLWSIPDDLKRFKELTEGHAVIMGRKTWESLPEKFRPLPNRDNIVVTRNAEFVAEGAKTAASIDEAIGMASLLSADVYIMGGAQIYEQSLPHVDSLRLTLVNDSKEADSFFPEYEDQFKKTLVHDEREFNGLKYQWVDFERK